jgi:hypothetical protein
VNSPPAARPIPTPTRTLGRRIEVRSYEGDLMRTVVPEKGAELFTAGLADQVGDYLRLKAGIRWIPSRGEKPSGRPDLDELTQREPDRYAANWRGSLDPHVGRGALGRRTTDRIIMFAPEARP